MALRHTGQKSGELFVLILQSALGLYIPLGMYPAPSTSPASSPYSPDSAISFHLLPKSTRVVMFGSHGSVFRLYIC